jgi:SAM-dependent methyltransferase
MADLGAAYSIGSMAEAQRVFVSCASTYDVTFASAMGYAKPQRIAALFLAEGGQTAQPVLDIGAGTGSVAGSLLEPKIDGSDRSPEMLEQAEAKSPYRKRSVADLTGPLPVAINNCSGFVCDSTPPSGQLKAATTSKKHQKYARAKLCMNIINPNRLVTKISAGRHSVIGMIGPDGSKTRYTIYRISLEFRK